MNRIIASAVVLLSFMFCTPNSKADTSNLAKARQFGATGQVTFRVVDSTGRPVEKANVRATFYESDSYEYVNIARGWTDSNGLFVANGKTIYDMDYDIRMDEFYTTKGKYSFYRNDEDCLRNGCWQPWNPTNTVVLKERRNPVAMYAKRVDVKIPIQGQAIGFDLAKGDWVAPHGQGAKADLLIKYTAVYDGPLVFSKRMEMTFSSPQDGVQSFPLDKTSEFMSLYTAPEEGYVPELVEEQARTRTEILRNSGIEKGQYLVLRVRSVTNEQGRIVSANYGKIYGSNLDGNPIGYGRSGEEHHMTFNYYFNPIANDRNLEYDPTQNLHGKTDRRRVSHP